MQEVLRPSGPIPRIAYIGREYVALPIDLHARIGGTRSQPRNHVWVRVGHWTFADPELMLDRELDVLEMNHICGVDCGVSGTAAP